MVSSSLDKLGYESETNGHWKHALVKELRSTPFFGYWFYERS